MICDPHHAEYTAAAAAMAEIYGRPVTQPKAVIRCGRVIDTYAVGDYVEFVDELGEPRRGYVIEVSDDDVYLVRCHIVGGGQRVIATHIDSIRPF